MAEVERPIPGQDDKGYVTVPEGWEFLLMGTDPATGEPAVLCGVTDDGGFHQWAPTEDIVTVCRQALEQAMTPPHLPGHADTAVTPPAAAYVDDDPDRQHGHTWRVTVHNRGHYCTPGPGGECIDHERAADYWDRTNTVEVHGHSLRAGLMRAAALPLAAWMGDHDPQEPDRG